MISILDVKKYAVRMALSGSDAEVGPACSAIIVAETIANDKGFRNTYEQGYRHALADVRAVLRCDGRARWAPRQLEVTTHNDTVPVFVDGDVGQCGSLRIQTAAGFGCTRWEAK